MSDVCCSYTSGNSYCLSLVDFLCGVARWCIVGLVSENISSALANNCDVYEKDNRGYGSSAYIKYMIYSK